MLKKYVSFWLPALMLGAAVLFAASSCGGAGSSSAQQAESSSGGQGAQEETTSGMQGMDMGSGGKAPATLVQNGDYSDERFIDMMVPHHQMAIDMAKVAQQNAEHPEIKQLAENIISDQQKEIDELKDIRKQESGSSDTPTQMSQSEMENMGMTMPDQLANQQPFDKAFIDSMLPHHASAVEMASVASMRSDNPQIQSIARAIIDAQSKEIGQMIEWRQQWYPEEGQGAS